MGICSSCLGFGRADSDDDDLSETSRLLRQNSHSRHYGANRAQDSVPDVDPELLRQQRDDLERICARTADNLIDISHAEEGSKTSADYARLFSEAFPPMPSSSQTNATESEEPQEEQAWLRRIMDKDPDDKSWDCNVILPIDKPLTFRFH